MIGLSPVILTGTSIKITVKTEFLQTQEGQFRRRSPPLPSLVTPLQLQTAANKLHREMAFNRREGCLQRR